MGAKYVDISSIVQVIGCIYQNPGLLDSEKYVFNEEDFTEEKLAELHIAPHTNVDLDACVAEISELILRARQK